MKKGDCVALSYFLILMGLIMFFIDDFILLTQRFPLIMGFFKVSLLATFGEMLKMRRATGEWGVSHLWQRFFVWGLFGIWFTWIFPLVSIGVEGIASIGIWPGFIAPLSKSLWVNILCGYAYFMMLCHEYINVCIARQEMVRPELFPCMIDRKMWFEKIPLTILWFWVPAHTITFCLPEHFRVLFAALLSIALGFLLTMGGKK